MFFQKNKIKQTEFAGSFYDGNAENLSNQLDDFFAHKVQYDVIPKAIIVPHAGYIYSGRIAAFAYNYVKKHADLYDEVIVFAPSHSGFPGKIAIPAYQAFNTPLGGLYISHKLQEEVAEFDQVIIDNKAFIQEHSIEVQFPFIKKIFDNNVKILPILLNDCDDFEVIQIIEKIFTKNRLIIISSDLSHFHDIKTQHQIDTKTINHIVDLEPDEIYYEHACGALAIKAMLKYIAKNSLSISNIAFGNSSDYSGDESRVVGYASFLIY